MSNRGGDDRRTVLPVVQEELEVGKRQVDRGGVRVTRHIGERTERVDLPLSAEELDVERVPVDTPAGAQPPEPRWEGDTLVVPVLEERLVVQKQLWVREELRITRRAHSVRRPLEVRLRADEVRVERFGAPPGEREP